MKTEESIRQAFRRWFGTASGLGVESVFTAGSGGGRDQKPYATILVTGFDLPEPGRDHVVVTEGNANPATTKTVGHRRALIDVEVYTRGPEDESWKGGLFPADYFARCRLGLKQAGLRDIACANGIAVRSVDATRDLTLLLETQHEARAAALFTIGYRNEIVDSSSGSIERITGTNDVSGVDASIDVS